MARGSEQGRTDIKGQLVAYATNPSDDFSYFSSVFRRNDGKFADASISDFVQAENRAISEQVQTANRVFRENPQSAEYPGEVAFAPFFSSDLNGRIFFSHRPLSRHVKALIVLNTTPIVDDSGVRQFFADWSKHLHPDEFSLLINPTKAEFVKAFNGVFTFDIRCSGPLRLGSGNFSEEGLLHRARICVEYGDDQPPPTENSLAIFFYIGSKFTQSGRDYISLGRGGNGEREVAEIQSVLRALRQTAAASIFFGEFKLPDRQPQKTGGEGVDGSSL